MDLIRNAAEKSKRKLTALPLLIVLFVISYTLLTRLVIEQDKTIDSQRSLIHMLFADNISLSTVHKHAAKLPKNLGPQGNIQVEFEAPGSTGSFPSSQIRSNQVQSQAQLTQVPSIQTPSTQVPSKQVQSNQVQSSKSGPQANSKTDHKGKTRRGEKLPARPPVELTDPSDMRRTSFSI
jgi:hypothetical protein